MDSELGEGNSSTDEEDLLPRAESPQFTIIVAPHPYSLPWEHWRCLARVPAEGPIPDELYWEVERVGGRGVAMGPEEIDLICRWRECGHVYGQCLDHFGWDPQDDRDFPLTDLSSISSREESEEEFEADSQED